MQKRDPRSGQFIKRSRSAVRGRRAAGKGVDPALLAEGRKWFPKGSTVFLVLRHRASSGMSRVIGVVSFRPARKGVRAYALHPNYTVSQLTGFKEDREKGGLKIGGAGMDMGYHLVSSLSQALYGASDALKHEWL